MGGLDYNTRLVILGSGILGAVCGLVGVYLLLRKRSLIGDAICHAVRRIGRYRPILLQEPATMSGSWASTCTARPWQHGCVALL